MKVKYSVKVGADEADDLFNILVAPALVSYPSIEEQSAALLKAKDDFKLLLNHYLTKSFKKGSKINKPIEPVV